LSRGLLDSRLISWLTPSVFPIEPPGYPHDSEHMFARQCSFREMLWNTYVRPPQEAISIQPPEGKAVASFHKLRTLPFDNLRTLPFDGLRTGKAYRRPSAFTLEVRSRRLEVRCSTFPSSPSSLSLLTVRSWCFVPGASLAKTPEGGSGHPPLPTIVHR